MPEELWLRGIDSSADDVLLAMKENKMLLLDMDLTPECDLNCNYCDRVDDRHIMDRVELSFEQRRSVIAEAKALGCQTVEIPGAGEPSLDPMFWKYLELINDSYMISVIFISGYARPGLLIDDQIAERLYDLNASIILKYNSMNHDIQDQLVGKKGYGKICDAVLNTLMDAGFNDTRPTRLGIHMVITPLNITDVVEVFRYCRQKNIFPFIVPLIPQGNALRYNMVISRDETLRILKLIQEIDRDEFGIVYDPKLPMVGGFVCRQINIGMFVNLFGDIYDCNGGCQYIGNVRPPQSLTKVWNSEKARGIREQPQEGYCPIRERFWGTSNERIKRYGHDF